ncbi:hypothetical protein jhhlp_002922 [Lomentospora prolificans]|uniref:Metallo-beta-lactamase domain-containing protein n=1 Tax=Lomentospora prolificans TaxID=41688 RepID=A0A2N3NFH7_9PEZI|nr:hypothetical protein jhhlp_002922 [Lomentospora prolificans]
MTMRPLQYLHLDPTARPQLLKSDKRSTPPLDDFPVKKSHASPNSEGGENARVLFIGTATTVIEWHGLRILTDPNFLHAGDHVHLGPGVNAERVTNPAVDLDQLPPVDVVLLSHYHADHFDQLVEESLNRDFPIVTTPHAKGCLASGQLKNDPFRNVTELDFFESLILLAPKSDGQKRPVVKVTGMPGKHVPPGPLAVANDILHAVPPTNGWMVELGYSDDIPSPVDKEIATGYRIYISGDTLFVDDLKQIPEWLDSKRIDLMLIHLGGTTIPGPSAPLVMVTMDAKQGIQLMRLVDPDITIPIHYDDYNVFLSSLDDFKKEIEQENMSHRVVYLERGDEFKFHVGAPPVGHKIGTY